MLILLALHLILLLPLKNLMAPPITGKKKLRNCDNVMKYLKKAGLSLCDVDGIQILAEDIANGDKELTLSILWNIFVNLQVYCTRLHFTLSCYFICFYLFPTFLNSLFC